MNGKIFVATVAMIPFLSVAANAQDNQAAIGYEYLNVRTEAKSDSQVAFNLKKDEKIKIIKEKNNWLQIKDKNNRIGWAPKEAIKNDPISINQSNSNSYTKTSARVKVSNNDTLNVRKGPGTNFPIIAVLKDGQKVYVNSESAGWSKVSFGDIEGYVSSNYLESVSDSKPGQKSILEVTSNILNLRKSKSISSQNLKVLKKGDRVISLESDDSWAKVEHEGTVGYVPTYFVKFIETIDETQPTPNGEDDNSVNEINNSYNGPINKSPGSTQNSNLNYSLEDMIDTQMSNFNTVVGGKQPSREDLEAALDPSNYTSQSDKMVFARLDEYKDHITAQQLNMYLNRYSKPGDVFYNKGQAFINAARKNNINPIYFVAHSMIETGNGKSRLATGNLVNGVTVYNFFGIGAVDGNAFEAGKATAYKNSWTSVDATLDGSAKWIADGYIHSPRHMQNTLYKMKFNYDNPKHQYASNIDWPRAIANKMNEIMQYSDQADINSYEIPSYR